MRRRIRTRTGLLLSIGVIGALAGWVVDFQDQGVAAALAWRLSFFCILAAVSLNLRLLWAVWQGRAHLWSTLRRSVPFNPSEFRAGTLLDVRRARAGVSGRGALVGVALIVVAMLVWLAGLGFTPLDASGTLSMRVGQKTSNVQPFGFRPDGVHYAHALPHEHTVMSLTDDREGVLMHALDPRTGETGLYELRPGEPAVLGPHRIHLEALSDDPRAPMVTLRFTQVWIWWWRLFVLTLGVLGVLLVVIFPHRSWVWLGQPGDYRLQAWSLNATSGLRKWSTVQLTIALGEEGMAELTSVEAMLRSSRQG